MEDVMDRPCMSVMSPPPPAGRRPWLALRMPRWAIIGGGKPGMFRILTPGFKLRGLAAVTLVAVLPGCVLLDLQKSGREQQAHGVVAVEVLHRPGGKCVSYAIVLGPDGVMASLVVPRDGLAAFLLPQGRPMDVAAFGDMNGNRRFDPGEPAGLLKGVVAQPLADASYRGAARPLPLAAGAALPSGLAVPEVETGTADKLQVNLGEVVRLGDPRFTAANGPLGFWQPYEFLARLGWGVYFLQPYDPGKIPVVFVYGIDGSPQDWRSMIASLDKSKYQPWFFHYPSGLRLEKSANGLSQALQLLKARHGFSQLYVVAHSMGGLVSRGAVMQAAAESGGNFVPKFLTLCSPWGGDAEADGGVKHLKYPVPAWIDMEPGSAYLKRLFASPLPAGMRHYLIFDFQTHKAPWLKPDNDGAVQVASELIPPAQAEATAMFGFNYGHVETLGKSDVHAKVNDFLNQ